MPIGVPRIIYCWGEELPPQWTDIYNFIFRRRMVFLMQYLDDELCNQICGLLINIHMEDRTKELEKKEIEKSGIFKSSSGGKNVKDSVPNLPSLGVSEGGPQINASGNKKLKKEKSMEDLLSSYSNSTYEDLAIDENHTLEQYTLQKITLEWLNWNAQFFDFSDEPYLFYLAEILSLKNSAAKDDTQLILQGNSQTNFRATIASNSLDGSFGQNNQGARTDRNLTNPEGRKQHSLDVYSPFRSIVNLASLVSKDKGGALSLKNLLPDFLGSNGTFNSSQSGLHSSSGKGNELNSTKNLLQQWPCHKLQQKPGLAKLIGVLASQDFVLANKNVTLSDSETSSIKFNKALGQRNLRREYAVDNSFQSASIAGDRGAAFLNQSDRGVTTKQLKNQKALNYLDFDSTQKNSESYLFADAKNRNEYSRKQTKKALQEEESKKVFVIINSFGGSVGNGITVHDALQFIKAGSLTLGLGVAASAASLVLAGGTISERYVTEGCHVMIHQPEGGINGQASDIWIDSQEIMKIRLDVAEIYSLSAHRPRHKILRDLDRDFYLNATETIHYGLADEIATNEVMHEIIKMTSKVWDYHDSKQQRLLEARDSASSGLNIETQN